MPFLPLQALEALPSLLPARLAFALTIFSSPDLCHFLRGCLRQRLVILLTPYLQRLFFLRPNAVTFSSSWASFCIYAFCLCCLCRDSSTFHIYIPFSFTSCISQQLLAVTRYYCQREPLKGLYSCTWKREDLKCYDVVFPCEDELFKVYVVYVEPYDEACVED